MALTCTEAKRFELTQDAGAEVHRKYNKLSKTLHLSARKIENK
jgi:hypothetical protein